MNIQDRTSNLFVLSENENEAVVKFRNTSTLMLFPDIIHAGRDLKFIEDRILTIKKIKSQTHLLPIRRRESFDELLEEAFEIFTMGKPKKKKRKISKKDILKIKRDNQIRAARTYIQNGYSAKTVKM